MLRLRKLSAGRPLAAVLFCTALGACGGGGGALEGATTGTPRAAAAASSATDRTFTMLTALRRTAEVSSSSSEPEAPNTASDIDAQVASSVLTGDAGATVHRLSVPADLLLETPGPVPAVVPPARSGARTFYVDSAVGDDSVDGRAGAPGSGHGPWRTLARLTHADLRPGDTVQLACGSVWHETLLLPTSGTGAAPLFVKAPGQDCSTAPLIDGGSIVPPSAWLPYRGHIYRTPLDAMPTQLLASTGNFSIAHHPNRSDSQSADPNSPYLALAAASDGRVLTIGADLVLPKGAKLDANTRVRVRTNAYLLDESNVASFDGRRITLAQAPTFPVASGWGYLLLGQLWMLDSAGEWYYDAATHQLYAWMPDSAAPSVPVAVGTLATGIDLSGRSHIVVDGVAIRNVGLGVDLRSTTDVTVRNLHLEDIADIGIDAAASSQDVIDSNLVSRTGGDAITGWGGAMGAPLADSAHLTVRNNVVRDSAVLMQGEKVLSLPRRSLAAVFTGTDSVVTGNVITDTGYIGILAQTGSVVEDNVVYGACSVLDDCGGIYTSGDYNRAQIRRNTVVHSRGALAGQPLGQRATAAQGIYIDDNGADLIIENNTVVDTDAGIQLHNARRNTLRGNRLYGNRRSQIWMQEDSNRTDPNGDMTGNRVEGNLMAPNSARAAGLLLTTAFGSTARFASFDANRYYDSVSAAVAVVGTAERSGTLDFAHWQGSTGSGSSSAVDLQGSATSRRGYTTFTVAGANLVANSALATDSAGWSSWNATAPAGTLGREACAAGMCLRYTAGGSDGLLSSPGFALQQGAWYRLSVDVATETDQQSVPLIVRLGSGDYASLSDRDLTFTASATFGRHTAVFQATRSVGAAGARIDIDGISAGKSIRIARMELVAIAPDPVALTSGVVLNRGTSPLAASCPFAGTQATLCTKLFDLSTDRPIVWPSNVAAHSSLLFYALEPTLVDRDGDGIPDSQDACPNSTPGAAVDAAGCEFTPTNGGGAATKRMATATAPPT